MREKVRKKFQIFKLNGTITAVKSHALLGLFATLLDRLSKWQYTAQRTIEKLSISLANFSWKKSFVTHSPPYFSLLAYDKFFKSQRIMKDFFDFVKILRTMRAAQIVGRTMFSTFRYA